MPEKVNANVHPEDWALPGIPEGKKVPDSLFDVEARDFTEIG